MSWLMIVALVLAFAAGWAVSRTLTYRRRAGHRRPPTPPRHRVIPAQGHPGRHEPRPHQHRHDIDPAVLEALARLEK